MVTDPKDSVSNRLVHPWNILAISFSWCIEMEAGYFSFMNLDNGTQKRLKSVTEAKATSQGQAGTKGVSEGRKSF